MKIALRIGRIFIKIILLIYVWAVNTILWAPFIVFLQGVFYLIFPETISAIRTYFGEAFYYIILCFGVPFLYYLYNISFINIYICKMNEGFIEMDGAEKEELKQIAQSLGLKKSLKFYYMKSTSLNACALGHKNIAFTRGTLNCSKQEISGVLCHEYSHLQHFDFYFSTFLFSYENLGRCGLYFLYIIFHFLSIMFAGIPFIGMIIASLLQKMAKLAYWLSENIIYGISTIVSQNINKYAEYRCDIFAAKKGYKDNLISFLNRVDDETCEANTGFLEYLLTSHPATHKRIAKMNKFKLADKNIQ